MKLKLGPVNALYPTPTVLVGANVNGKPNFIAIAHIGILTMNDVSIGMAKSHYTNAGIRENGTFSICLPSEELVAATDYCGLVSGRDVDKGALFEVFYGTLKTAPLIRECKVCMECHLDRIYDYPNHDVFAGEVVETHADEAVLSAGKIDVAKLKPLLFDMNSRKYWTLGGAFAGCWDIGNRFKER